MANAVQRFEAHPMVALPIDGMSDDVQGAFDYLEREVIKRDQSGNTGEYGPDPLPVIEKQFERLAPRCDEANCCRNIMLEDDGRPNTRPILRIVCPTISETDEEAAVRREGRCERTIGRVAREFPEFVVARAEAVRSSQERVQSLESGLRSENTHLDTLLT